TRGELERAEEMYRKALAIEEALGRKEGMASDYGNLGILYWDRGELDRAEEMYRKSLAINEALGRKEGMASDYGNLGNLYRDRGELERAEEMYRKSLQLFSELKSPQVKTIEELLKNLRSGTSDNG
ncbi:MAG TPA: tetratricopeptide repeat protein, partial [Noviherbaspirillum sp.]